MSTTPALRRLGYGTYEIARGPATGTIIRRSDNPTALPCFRWQVVAGPLGSLGMGSTDGFRLRGLARSIAAKAEARQAVMVDE